MLLNVEHLEWECLWNWVCSKYSDNLIQVQIEGVCLDWPDTKNVRIAREVSDPEL